MFLGKILVIFRLICIFGLNYFIFNIVALFAATAELSVLKAGFALEKILLREAFQIKKDP